MDIAEDASLPPWRLECFTNTFCYWCFSVTEAVRDSEYRVSFQVVGNNVALVMW